MTAHIFNAAQLTCIVLQTAKLIVISVTCRMESLCGKNSIVVIEENKDNGYIFKYFF